MAIERLLYLNLELRRPRGFSTIKHGPIKRLLYLNLNYGDQEASLRQFERKVTKGFSTTKPRSIETLLYLNLELHWPRGFFTSIWKEGNQGASVPWNLGRLRGFSISNLNCYDQGDSLPWFEWKVTKGLLYVGNLSNLKASLSQSQIMTTKGAFLPQSEWTITKGLLYLGTWGDWDASLSYSWITGIEGLLYLDLNGR